MSNQDIYKLVEEMNKNKTVEHTGLNSNKKEVEDIFSMLNEVQEKNNISVEDVRRSVNRSSEINLNTNYGKRAKVIKKPTLPSNVEYDLLSDGIIAYISNVEYGDNDSDYVLAHRSALEKYYKEIVSNRKDISVVECHVNDEISALDSRNTLSEKGYYDGLYYVLRAIKKAKSEVSFKINEKLKEKLN